jgi:proline dehydrogenase
MYNNFVRIDMEDHTTTNDTIAMYRELRKEFDNVGTVLQAYLRRTVNDVNQLIPIHPNLRICKGIYIEPYPIAYQDRDIIVRNFAYILEKLFINNCYIGIATHDEKVAWEALRLIDRYNIKKDRYEFQMLLGVDLRMRRRLIDAGHKLRVYVPFGAEWAQYSIRRLKENPHIVGHVTRHLIRNTFKKDGV